jgi:sigma-B regulation protein RsbU (phosphoserine phosphatase)
VPLAVAAVFVGLAQPGAVTEGPAIATGLLVIVSLVLRQMLEAAELAKRERQVRTMADRLADELGSASKYVASTLPGDLEGPVRVRSRYLPAREIGGDSFGYLWIDDDHLIVYLIDVSGYGVAPAMLSVSVHNLLRSRSMPTETLLAPEQVMVELNAMFRAESNDEHYFTLWYGVYQASSRTLRYASAGHPPTLTFAYQQNGVQMSQLSTQAIPVGMLEDTEFSCVTYLVPPGCQLLLYSDGLFELARPDGTRWSWEEFTALCADLAVTPDWSVDTLIGKLRDLPIGGLFEDDCSLLRITFD